MAYGPHRGWRIRFTSPPGYINIYDLMFQDRHLNRVPNIGTVVESDHYAGDSYPPSKAFDGDPNTLWSGKSNANGLMYLGFFYDTPVSLGGFRAVGDTGNAFVIEYSEDNVTWTPTTVAGSQFAAAFEIDGYAEVVEKQPHIYWRVLSLLSQNNNSASFGELRFIANGVNLATGGAARSNGDHSSGSYPKEAGFDGNVNTFWLSAGQALPYLGYVFPTPVLPDTLQIQRRNDGYGPDEAVRDFAYQWSDDGITWTTARLFQAEPWWGDTQVRTYDVHSPTPNMFRRKWRLRNTGWSLQGTAISIAELELRTTFGGTQAATGGASFATNYNTSFGPDAAFNNSNRDFWLANSPAGCVGYNFPVQTNVVEYAIYPRGSYPQEAPKSWVLEYSEANGFDWTQVDSRQNVPDYPNSDDVRVYQTVLPIVALTRRRSSPIGG